MFNNLSVSEIESILLNIRRNETFINQKRDKRNQEVAFFQELITTADNIFQSETKDAFADIAVLKNQLEQYFNANPPAKGKSIKFAAGSFGYNNSMTKFFFNGQECNADNKELLDFLKKDGDRRFIKVKEFVDWAALKKNLYFDKPENVFFADTGQLLENFRAKQSFSVKVK